MDNRLLMLGGVGLGAGLMFLLDPGAGRRRRKLVIDKAGSLAGRGEEAIGRTARDLRNRAEGVVAETRSRLRREDDVEDSVLEARVRAKLGRYVSHPGAIEVVARGGRVTVAGPILADELDRSLKAVRSVRGVREVENHLEPHEDVESVPGLQGGRERPGERMEVLQREWSPTARLLVGLAGGGLAVYGARRRDAVGAALSSVGVGLVLRGLDLEPSSVPGLGDGGVRGLFRSAVAGVTGRDRGPEPAASSLSGAEATSF